MRPKSTARDLPPRMLRRTKKLKSGKIWIGYYYNGRDSSGRRVEISLGTDLDEAKRKWAELERKPISVDLRLMKYVFERYEREVVPTKALSTQRDYLQILGRLKDAFGSAPIDSIATHHLAIYRDRRSAPVRANRELAVFSSAFNYAREWGLTNRENPARGLRKNAETPREFYVDDDVWNAVYRCAVIELRDAMDLSYLTGQRPGDVLKMMKTDIKNGALEVKQGKTGKRLRILLNDADGMRTGLGKLVDQIQGRQTKTQSMFLVATQDGAALNRWTLRIRFDAARKGAADVAAALGTAEALALASRVRQFQFRDIRPKAASDIEDLGLASRLLGHTEQQITRKVYRRVGETVKPTK
jgi:integrase